MSQKVVSARSSLYFNLLLGIDVSLLKHLAAPLSSAFKACHPKVKSFYFAADGVDDMNR